MWLFPTILHDYCRSLCGEYLVRFPSGWCFFTFCGHGLDFIEFERI